MLRNITTRIYKYADLSHKTLVNIKKWLQPGFPIEAFSNPALKVAQATNAAGQEIIYFSIESALVVGSLAHNPLSTDIERQWAGADIEAAITHQAAQTGATSMLVVLPSYMPYVAGQEFIRVCRRNISPTVTRVLASESTTAATKFAS